MKQKLHGGTLFYALGIGVIAGILMSSVIVAEFYHRMLLRSDLTEEEVVRNAESGIIYSCTHFTTDSTDVDLFKRGKDSVSMQRRMWGAYDVVISTAHTGTHSSTRIAMVGGEPNAKSDHALWLADMDRALSIAGSTILKGNCFLPQAGIERAYIEGKSFAGRELVQGSISASLRFMETYDDVRIKELQRMLRAKWNPADSVEGISSIDLTELDQSFLASPLVLFESSALILNNCRLTGQIIIYSPLSISVDESAVLADVILVAPKIYLAEQVRGNFQVIARDTITVGAHTALQYPSVLAIIPDELATEHPSLLIGRNAEINGSVFLACDQSGMQRTGNILLKENSIVQGELFSYGTVDLKGTVNGSVTCQKFVLKTNSAVYENALMDATIDTDARNSAWLSSLFYADNHSENVIQWLH
jgi:hypothetical protein